MLARVGSKRARGRAASRYGVALLVAWVLSCDAQVLHLLPEGDAGRLQRDGGVVAEGGKTRASCENDGQCAWPVPYCERPEGRCVGCRSGADCDGPEQCDPLAMRCVVRCDRDSDCRSNTGFDGQLCDQTRGFCVECVQDADCGSRSRHHCDETLGQCVD